MARKIKNKYIQPPSSILRSDEDGVDETRKDLGKAVDDANVLKNVTQVNKKGEGKDLPSYKEAWDIDLEGIKGMYGSYDDYVNDMENIQEGDERDIEREAAREKSLEGSDETDYELEDIEKPGSPGDKTNPFTSPQGRGNYRLNQSQSNKAVKNFRKQKRNMTDSDFAEINAQRVKDGKEPFKNKSKWFKQQKSNVRSRQAEAQDAAAGNAADQLKQGRNPYTSGEAIEYRKEMSKKQDGSDITQLTENEAENYSTIDELKKKNENPSAVGQFGFGALKFGRRK